jgi:hypothetical protein
MQGQNLSKISAAVINFFGKTAKQVGKSVKFVKRKSKLNAKLFAESLIIGCLSHCNVSLEDMCQLLKQRRIKITKQGMYQRFNPEATELMRTLFTRALQQFKSERCDVINLLKPFTSVELLDSSNVSLPEKLKNVYKGFGGGASDASLKIQVLFNYIDSQISDAEITSALKNDQCFEGHLNKLKKGALYLQDLGYFKVDSFIKMNTSGSFFVSRYLIKTAIFDENNQRMCLLDLLRNAGNFFAKKAWLKRGKNKVAIRLVAHRLSDEDAEKRIRKIKNLARKKGKIPKQETLELARWSICITNVPENILKDEQIYLVYSLRWQIELFFKLCKSEVGIDKFNGKKIDRILCELYAKLICIVILLHLCVPVRWQNNRELSFKKAYKQLKQRTLDFFKALQSKPRLVQFLKGFLSDLKDFGFKDKHRKKKRLTYQKLMDTTGQETLA